MSSNTESTRTFEVPGARWSQKTERPPAPRPALACGERIAQRFEILRLLGAGGMGQVYAAKDLELGVEVALKVIRPELAARPGAMRRFKREVDLARRVTHPNVCRIFDLASHRSSYPGWGSGPRLLLFLTMELLSGRTLTERLARGGALDAEQALGLLRPLADGLDAAHAAGVLHRDFKCSNILLVPGDGGERAVVTDFGLAQALARDEKLPAAGSRAGTPGYMAPEAEAGKPLSAAADIYSFGVVMQQVRAGTPSVGASAEAVAELEPAWRQVIQRCLDPDPGRRFRTAREALESLDEEAGSASPRGGSRPPLLVVLALASCLAAAAFLAAGWLRGGLGAVEALWLDACFATGPNRQPTAPISLVLIDDATLGSDPKPLVDLADAMGVGLARVLDGGAKGIGINLLLPESWSASEPFSDLLIRHSERLALAVYMPTDGEAIGAGVAKGLTAAALGPRGTRTLFGSVNLHPDSDGVPRRLQPLLPTLDGGGMDSFATRVARILLQTQEGAWDRRWDLLRDEKPVWIDYRLDLEGFDTMAWKDLPQALDENPERFRGRVVLVGASFSGSGESLLRIPRVERGAARASSPLLQALAVHTLVDGAQLKRPERTWLLPGSALLALLAAGAALRSNPTWLLLPALTLALSWAAFVALGLLVPVTEPLLTVLLAGVAGAGLRRQVGKRWEERQ